MTGRLDSVASGPSPLLPLVGAESVVRGFSGPNLGRPEISGRRVSVAELGDKVRVCDRLGVDPSDNSGSGLAESFLGVALGVALGVELFSSKGDDAD